MISKMVTLGLKLAIAEVGFNSFKGFMLTLYGNENWSCGIYVSYGNGFRFCRIEYGEYKVNTIGTSTTT
jgi:hypothetical protein